MGENWLEDFCSLRRKSQSGSLPRLEAVNRDEHIISAWWKNRFSTLATKFKNNGMTKFFSFSKISTPTNQNLEFIILNSTMVTTRRKIFSQILRWKSFASFELFQTTFTHAFSESEFQTDTHWNKKLHLIDFETKNDHFVKQKWFSKLPSMLAKWPLFRPKSMSSSNWAFCK